MIIGRFVCSACGRDCTPLYGYIMQKRSTLTRQQIEEFDRVQKEYGQSEFVFCWGCTAKAFGVKTLAEKAEAEKPKARPAPAYPFRSPAEIERLKKEKGDINDVNDQ